MSLAGTAGVEMPCLVAVTNRCLYNGCSVTCMLHLTYLVTQWADVLLYLLLFVFLKSALAVMLSFFS